MIELKHGKFYLVWYTDTKYRDGPVVVKCAKGVGMHDEVKFYLGSMTYCKRHFSRVIPIDDLLAAWKERQAANRALAACVEAMEKASPILNPDAAFVDTAMFEAGVALDEALAKATAVMKENGNG